MNNRIISEYLKESSAVENNEREMSIRCNERKELNVAYKKFVGGIGQYSYVKHLFRDAMATYYRIDRIEKRETIQQLEFALSLLKVLKVESVEQCTSLRGSMQVLEKQITRLNKELELSCYDVKGDFITFKNAASHATVADSTLSENDIRNAARRGDLRTWSVQGRRYLGVEDLNKFIEEHRLRKASSR